MKKTIVFLVIFLGATFWSVFPAMASPYNAGIYNENVPYGTETYLAISTDGDVSLAVTPTSSGTEVTGNSEVTVTSTDVVGYQLFIRSETTTDMDNLGALIPTSGNGSPAALAINTWGYNTDASSNFVGSSLTDTLIRNFDGPAPSGDLTTVTFGIYIDLAKPAGNYSTQIVYTAVPSTY